MIKFFQQVSSISTNGSELPAYDSEQFKSAFNVYIERKKKEYDACSNFISKFATRYKEKTVFQKDLFRLIDNYEAARRNGNSVNAKQLLLDKINTGIGEFAGLGVSAKTEIRDLLIHWKVRLNVCVIVKEVELAAVSSLSLEK